MAVVLMTEATWITDILPARAACRDPNREGQQQASTICAIFSFICGNYPLKCKLVCVGKGGMMTYFPISCG